MASEAEEFKAFEAGGWSRRADTYGRVTGAITARFVDPLLDAAGVGAGMRVLDVATGPGHVAAAAAARGGRARWRRHLRGNAGRRAAPSPAAGFPAR